MIAAGLGQAAARMRAGGCGDLCRHDRPPGAARRPARTGRGLPAIAAANAGRESLARYIGQFDQGAPVQVMVGRPEIAGRYFYDATVQDFNFHRRMVPLKVLLSELVRFAGDPAAPALYAGSAPTGQLLPGWSDANPLALTLPAPRRGSGSVNETRISTHFDGSANLACVVGGRRRFLLFPPDQLANLYVGPLEQTMAGQPTSMVDPDAPTSTGIRASRRRCGMRWSRSWRPATRSSCRPCGGTTSARSGR